MALADTWTGIRRLKTHYIAALPVINELEQANIRPIKASQNIANCELTTAAMLRMSDEIHNPITTVPSLGLCLEQGRMREQFYVLISLYIILHSRRRHTG